MADSKKYQVVGSFIGPPGPPGSDATVTSESIQNALGYIPASKDDLGTGGNGGSAIIDVVELPTEDINEDVFYRLLTGVIYFNGTPQNQYTCHVVKTLPAEGIPATTNMVNVVLYYAVDTGAVSGYVDSALSSAMGAPVGWYPVETLAQAFGISWGGTIWSETDDPRDDAFRIVLSYSVYQYKRDWENFSEKVGRAGTSAWAEIFNSLNNTASGIRSHAEGSNTTASGEVSHAEGSNTTASGEVSHAEGSNTTASGEVSHAEGGSTTAKGNVSHAEGMGTTASEYASHAEGSNTTASGSSSHAEGMGTTASGDYSHAEGESTIASEYASHAEGSNTTSEGNYSHAEGYSTTASASSSHAEGSNTTAIGQYSHAEGSRTAALGDCSHAEGSNTTSEGYYSHAEGYDTTASGSSSHAEGGNTTSEGNYSHAEGYDTTASGSSSHAEGGNTTAKGYYSHAEGYSAIASGDYSHAEGHSTTASGIRSHAEGHNTTASGYYSHAEGYRTTASGEVSHAEGYNIIASGRSQHVQGEYNIYEDTSSNVRGKYAHIVGNGTFDNDRSNAHTLDWEGNAWYAGDVYVGSTSGKQQDEGSKKLATEEFVTNAVANAGGSGSGSTTGTSVQSDWNQNDETAADYIKNKPFGNIVAGTIFDDNIELVLDENFGWATLDPETAEPPSMSSALAVGDEVEVIYNDTSYSTVCKATPDAGIYYFGNASIYGLPYLTIFASINNQTVDEYIAEHPDEAWMIEDTGEPFYFMTADAMIVPYMIEAGTHHFVINAKVVQKLSSSLIDWAGGNAPSSLPDVTTNDNDKVLMVVDGVWAAGSIANGDEVAY